MLLLDSVPLVEDRIFLKSIDTAWGQARRSTYRRTAIHQAYVSLSSRTMLADLKTPFSLSNVVINELEKSLEIASSTREDLSHQLLKSLPSNSSTAPWQDPILVLFQIIEKDTKELLHLLQILVLKLFINHRHMPHAEQTVKRQEPVDSEESPNSSLSPFSEALRPHHTYLHTSPHIFPPYFAKPPHQPHPPSLSSLPPLTLSLKPPTPNPHKNSPSDRPTSPKLPLFLMG